MVEKLGIDKSKIENLGNLLYKNYGTTMAGLRVRTVLYIYCSFPDPLNELFDFFISNYINRRTD